MTLAIRRIAYATEGEMEEGNRVSTDAHSIWFSLNKKLTCKSQTRIFNPHIIQERIMNAIHAGVTVSVTELRESPTRILKRAEDEDQAVAILNHNKPAGYIISPRMMEAMLDSIADRIAENRAEKRLATLNKARKVKLDEL